MRRMLDPVTLAPVVTEWSQYDGDWVHADFEISGGAAVTTRHYFGAGHADVDASGDWTDQAVAFGNQIGSTELLVDGNGQVAQDWAYTAFGEMADLGGTGDTRYRYAGDWGYEANPEIGAGGLALPFLHVGFRWYDPETGRFLQSDPIGIEGGLNVYAYLEGNPVWSVDPDGLIPIEGVTWPPEIITPAEREGRRRATARCLSLMFDVATFAVPGGVVYKVFRGAPFVIRVAKVAATGRKYRGGVKITTRAIWRGRIWIRDTIVRNGRILHDHWKGRPPVPPLPPPT